MLMFRMGDIFALATTLYEISTGQKPFQEKSDDEISALFRSQTYPDLQNLSPPGLGDIIRSCWLERYAVAEQVVCDLRKILLMFRLSLLILRRLSSSPGPRSLGQWAKGPHEAAAGRRDQPRR
jgi:serine/threonine protein kinase